MNWAKIMKTILDDPEDFFQNDGWNFLATDSDVCFLNIFSALEREQEARNLLDFSGSVRFERMGWKMEKKIDCP